MVMIAKLLTLRNTAILAGVMGAVIVGQWLLVLHKNNRIDKLKFDNSQLEYALDAAINANESNQQTIAELSAANQQCALTREANSKHAEQELTRHKGRVADITNKYDELRKQIPKFGKCADAVIDDDVIRMLQANGSN